MTVWIASRRLPSSENTSFMRCFTMSRVSRCGGTAVAVPAIVATAVATFDLALTSDSGSTAKTCAASSGFGDRMEDKIRLLWFQLDVLGGKRCPAPDFESLNQHSKSPHGGPEKT